MKYFENNLRIITLCTAFFVLGLLCLNQMIVYTPDSARYLIWADSFARLEGFRDATSPDANRYLIHAPLYSALLSPGEIFFHFSVVAAKFITLLVGCLTLYFLFSWLKQRVGEWYALFGTALLALNPLMLMFSTQILSDVPFALCFILFFIFINNIRSAGRQYDSRGSVYLGIIITAAVLLREVGISLMVSAAVYYLWKRKYRIAATVFAVPFLFYLLWVLRNEILVTNNDSLLVKNFEFYFAHLYTSSRSWMAEEFLVRLWSNLVVYTKLIGKLLFMPEYLPQTHNLVSQSDPFIALVLKVLPVLQYFFIIIASVFIIWGARIDIKKSKMLPIILITFSFYFILILLYPVIDIRFLFPPMMTMIYYFVIGIKEAVEWSAKRTKIAKTGVMPLFILLILFVPNIGWIQNYISNNLRYSQRDEAFYNGHDLDPDYPELFLKPLHLAGEWLVRNTDSSAVIQCNWKELAIWLDGRKLVQGAPLALPAQFDNSIRDYEVGYIVAVNWRSGLNECEENFVRSLKYSFKPVYRIGKVNIYQVVGKDGYNQGDADIRPGSDADSLFGAALKLLDDDPQEGRKDFGELVKRMPKSSVMNYYFAIAKEFSGELDSAELIFKKYSSLPQGAAFAQRAGRHLDIILRLREAAASHDLHERSVLFNNISIDCWNLGYRKRALQFARRSIDSDSLFIPAIVNSGIYLLQTGDTMSARRVLKMGEKADPSQVLIHNLLAVINYFDSLKTAADAAEYGAFKIKIAKLYSDIGLYDKSVDELISLTNADPLNLEGLNMLASLFEMKGRYNTALNYYKAIQQIDPLNFGITEKIYSLNRRFK